MIKQQQERGQEADISLIIFPECLTLPGSKGWVEGLRVSRETGWQQVLREERDKAPRPPSQEKEAHYLQMNTQLRLPAG